MTSNVVRAPERDLGKALVDLVQDVLRRSLVGHGLLEDLVGLLAVLSAQPSSRVSRRPAAGFP